MEVRSVRGRRLPGALASLSGWAWWAWWAFLALTLTLTLLAVLGIGFYLRDNAGLTPTGDYQMGFAARNPFVTGVADDGAVVEFVLSREARASGLRRGDRVVAINGSALGGGQRPIPALWARLGAPRAVAIETVSPDGRRAIRHLTSLASHADERVVESGLYAAADDAMA